MDTAETDRTLISKAYVRYKDEHFRECLYQPLFPPLHHKQHFCTLLHTVCKE